MAINVLDNDNGVIDHEAHGDSKCHQGQIVEAEIERVHGRE
jgi:hypothetical protein